MAAELPPQESGDDRAIRLAIEQAETQGTPISDVAAKMIASQYHCGQASAYYSLASTGAIDELGLHREYAESRREPSMTELDVLKLDELGYYCLTYGERGPVDDWAALWASPEERGDAS